MGGGGRGVGGGGSGKGGRGNHVQAIWPASLTPAFGGAVVQVSGGETR